MDAGVQHPWQAFKLQAEYMRRTEDGSLAYDVEGAGLSDAYRSEQDGWYVQGVYQFNPRWRFGLRYDELDSGSTRIGLVQNGDLLPAISRCCCRLRRAASRR